MAETKEDWELKTGIHAVEMTWNAETIRFWRKANLLFQGAEDMTIIVNKSDHEMKIKFNSGPYDDKKVFLEPNRVLFLNHMPNCEIKYKKKGGGDPHKKDIEAGKQYTMEYEGGRAKISNHISELAL